MNVEALFLFLILLLSLVLCSFLGGNCNRESFSTNNNQSQHIGVSEAVNGVSNNSNSTQTSSSYDHYNHFNKNSTALANGATFTGQNGGTITVHTNSDGTQNLQVTLKSGESPMTFTNKSSNSIEGYTTYTAANGSATQFYGPNGSTATVIQTNGQNAIRVKTSTGTYTFTESNSYYNPNSTINSSTYFGSTGSPIVINNSAYGNTLVYYGPNGATIRINVNGINTLTVTQPDGTTTIYTGAPDTTGTVTTYVGPNGGTATIIILSNGEKGIKVTDSYGNSVTYTTSQNQNANYNAGAVTGPQGNSAYYATGPNGNTVAGTTNQNQSQNTGYYGGSAGAVTGPQGNSAYYATGPNGNTVAGITANQIPDGDEDLYILKSQIVPPVCPACPSSSACPRQEKCPACPACARCPEPAFDCKKVPNYNATNQYLPVPVLNDFSTFGA